MKKKVRVKVVNADWEIRKHNFKERLHKSGENVKNGVKFCARAFFSGAGFATVFIIKHKLRDL